MLEIRAERLGFSFSDRVRLLSEVNFHLVAGWYGVVGGNGAGKTTLARLLARELVPTSGRLRLEPSGARVCLVAEELHELPDNFTRFAQARDRESIRWRAALGLEAQMLARFTRLSPGERKRWQLAWTLATLPDVLILDEPTNHLDQEGRALLHEALGRFRGIGLLISHDRALLDALTTQTLRVHGGRVELIPGHYSRARALLAAANERSTTLRQAQQRRIRALTHQVGDLRRDTTSAELSRSARTRMKNHRDHDASSFARTDRAAKGAARLSQRLSVKVGELERQRGELSRFEVDPTLGRSLFVGFEPAPKRALARLVTPALAAGEHLLLREVSVVLERHQKVHLRGPNGCGKTTLLRALLDASPHLEGRILYLPQELTLEARPKLRERLLSLDPQTRGRVLALVAALGVEPERVLASESWSPGEERKLWLALGLATHAQALILDEPTNHLDLPCIERLEQALVAYPGALLLVSHDQHFAERCTSSSWEIREGRVHGSG